jgi:hypothetical protein
VFYWSQNTVDTFNFCDKAISFNFTVDLYIYFPTSNMAIIGTLPSRFSDKNQKLYKLQRDPDTSMHIKNIYISIQDQGKSIGNIQNYEALEGVYWTT